MPSVAHDAAGARTLILILTLTQFRTLNLTLILSLVLALALALTQALTLSLAYSLSPALFLAPSRHGQSTWNEARKKKVSEREG